MILLCPCVCVYVMIDKDSHLCLQGVFWSAPCVCSGCSLMLLCAHRSLSIMEYGSTPYVGMAREKNGGPIYRIQNHTLRTRLFRKRTGYSKASLV